jgi:hypothetical protein
MRACARSSNASKSARAAWIDARFKYLRAKHAVRFSTMKPCRVPRRISPVDTMQIAWSRLGQSCSLLPATVIRFMESVSYAALSRARAHADLLPSLLDSLLVGWRSAQR